MKLFRKKTEKATVSTCPSTYPLATKINAVTPIREAVKDKQFPDGSIKNEPITIITEQSHRTSSNDDSFLNGFFILVFPFKQ